MDNQEHFQGQKKFNEISFIPVITINPDRKETVKVKAFFLVTLSLLIATIATVSYLIAFQPTEEGAFFKESQYGGAAAVYNLAFMLSLVIIFTLIIYLMIRRGLINILTILQGLLLGLLAGSIGSLYITLWTFEALITAIELQIINVSENVLITLLVVIEYTFFVILFVTTFLTTASQKLRVLKNSTLLFTASLAGSYFGLSLGRITPIILLVGFAIYDIFAVFRGPLKLITDELKQFMDEEDVEKDKTGLIIGLGDIFFYSLAVSYTLAFLNIFAFLFVVISLVVGYYLTIRIVLEGGERKALPALPLPILLSLIFILLFLFI